MKKKEINSLVIIALVSVITRGMTLFVTVLGSDEITIGLMALRVMGGDFPVFFLGQSFMGSLEAYLGGSFFQFFGPSPLTLELLAVILSFLFLILLYLLAKTIFGYRTALLSIALLAIPPLFLTGWSHEARLHYHLAIVLGNFLLLIAHKLMVRSEYPKNNRGLFIALGLLSGIGWWTNYLIAAYILPAGLFIFLKDKKVLFRKNFFFLLFMFLVGSLPLWTYNAIHHFPIAGITKMGDGSNVIPHLKALFINALPMLFGFQPPLNQDYLELAGYLIIGPIYLSAILYFVYKSRQALLSALSLNPTKTTGGEILLLLFLANILLNLLTPFGKGLSDDDQRYLLPLYTCLPVFVSVLLIDMKRKFQLLSFLLLGLIIFSNLIGNIRHDGWVVLNAKKLLTYQKINAKEARLTDFLIKNGYTRLYWGAQGKRLIFRSKEAIISVHPSIDGGLNKYVDLVDGSSKVTYLSQGEDKIFEANMKALGGSYRKITAPDGYLLYSDFKPPQEAFRMIPRHRWTGTSNLYPTEVEEAFDGNVSTGWGTKGPQKKGTYFLLDLGRVETIGKVSYIPASYYEVPAGYQVAVSLDNKNWQIAASVPKYLGQLFWSGPTPMMKVRYGRVETVFPAIQGRFLKISLLENREDVHWSINELFLFSPEKQDENKRILSPEGREIDLLLTFLTSENIHFVYANNWLSAVLRVRSDWKIRSVISNYFTGDNGETEPSAERYRRAHLDREVALVVEKEDEDLEKLLLEYEFSFRKQNMGPFVVYYGFSSPKGQSYLPVKDWAVTTNTNPLEAQKAVDRKPLTRWSSRKPQEPGMYYQVDLKTAQSVKGFTLSLGNSHNDYPRSLRVLWSLDERNWQEVNVTARSELYWTGETLLKKTGEKTHYFFSPVQLRYLRLVEEGRDPVYWWSIQELELF